jgi:hypothetical protein
MRSLVGSHTCILQLFQGEFVIATIIISHQVSVVVVLAAEYNGVLEITE